MERKIELLTELVEDYKKGKLSDFTAILIVCDIINPQIVPKEAIDWGRSHLTEL